MRYDIHLVTHSVVGYHLKVHEILNDWKNIDKTLKHVNTISENIEKVEIIICFTQEMQKA